MEDDRRMTWIGRHLEIVDATDPTLIGRQGLVLDETQRTLNVLEGDRTVRLGKAGLTFTLDGGRPLEGSHLQQRAEDRINRKHGRN